MATVLVTGPTRSGKSQWAEQLAAQTHQPVVYLATALQRDDDPEWNARIRQHQQRRPPDWQTVEVHRDIGPSLLTCPPSSCCLVDSLGTWVANQLEQDPESWQTEVDHFLTVLEEPERRVILVAEEVGWGVVPAYPMGRLFRDRLGELCQQVGSRAEAIYLVVAGYALDLKRVGQSIHPSLHP